MSFQWEARGSLAPWNRLKGEYDPPKCVGLGEGGEVLRIYDHIPEKRYINPFSASRNQSLEFYHWLHVFFDADGRLGSYRRYRDNSRDGIQVRWDPEAEEHRGQIVRAEVSRRKQDYPLVTFVREATSDEVEAIVKQAEAMRNEALVRKQK